MYTNDSESPGSDKGGGGTDTTGGTANFLNAPETSKTSNDAL